MWEPILSFNRRNILPEMNDAYLRSCQRANDSLCPIFRLGDVIREAGEKFSEMAVEVSYTFNCSSFCCESYVQSFNSTGVILVIQCLITVSSETVLLSNLTAEILACWNIARIVFTSTSCVFGFLLVTCPQQEIKESWNETVKKGNVATEHFLQSESKWKVRSDSKIASINAFVPNKSLKNCSLLVTVINYVVFLLYKYFQYHHYIFKINVSPSSNILLKQSLHKSNCAV